MNLPYLKSRLLTPRIFLLGLSFLSTVICAVAGAAHYHKSAWTDVWQPIGWLLSMALLVAAFYPKPRGSTGTVRSLVNPKTGLFLFWIFFFIASHLWNFRTAPWNGNALFDEAANDLLYLKTNVIGHPYQAAWFHGVISRETLFHYYVWAFLKLFGFNILSYQAALFGIWLATFVFMLLLVDLFFDSYVVTSVTALAFNFLPFAFIYTFVGYRYPMTAALALVSLYFLHLGFRTRFASTQGCSHGAERRSEIAVPDEKDAAQRRSYNESETACRTRSSFYLSLGGIAAGLSLASSIPGKQYVLALVIAAPLYAAFYWRSLKRSVTWSALAIVVYSFLTAAATILLYIAFNREAYTSYEASYLRDFWHAVQRIPAPHDLRYYVTGLKNCFFSAQWGPRLLFPDCLPVPLPYYWLLLPGLVLAFWEKRFEIVPLATLPVLGVFVSGGPAVEQRLVIAIPFWIILISFTVAGIVKLRRWPGVQIVLGTIAGLILLDGLVPSVRYIYAKTKNPFSIHQFAQHQVAVSRFLKDVVAGQEHPGPPRIERDEFNRIKGITDAPYDTFICQNDAFSIIHLFLHDYDDNRILSFCAGLPFFYVMTEQDVWNANKKAILSYVPRNKDLKLIWERGPETGRIITRFQSLRGLGTEDSISFSFGGRTRTFYVLNIPNGKIQQFQQAVDAFPATPQPSSSPATLTSMFQGGKGTGRGQFDSPTGIAIDGNGNILVADTNNARIEKFSPTGTFLSIMGSKGTGQGQLATPNGIAVDRNGNIYVADASKHSVEKFAPDGTFTAAWKGPDLGFYGPRRIAVGPDDSVYVVDQGRNRIVKFSSDGRVLAIWGGKGSGNGQFDDPTSAAVDHTTSKVYVADPRNRRIQIFDSNGKFITKWAVPEWGQPAGFEDLTIDAARNRVYASSANINAVIVFDLNGARIGTLTPKPPGKIDGPSAMALADGKLFVLDKGGNRVAVIGLQPAQR